jgi:hypothetical protein
VCPGALGPAGQAVSPGAAAALWLVVEVAQPEPATQIDKVSKPASSERLRAGRIVSVIETRFSIAARS